MMEKPVAYTRNRVIHDGLTSNRMNMCPQVQCTEEDTHFGIFLPNMHHLNLIMRKQTNPNGGTFCKVNDLYASR